MSNEELRKKAGEKSELEMTLGDHRLLGATPPEEFKERMLKKRGGS